MPLAPGCAGARFAPVARGGTVNRLAKETSPYLQQHRDNPVDWFPWGEEALALARAQDKPILLSVGYSACHWCHVMAHESFEDAGVAAVMNRLFINIKVDREERPDLDQIYQSAHHLLTQQSGGWPLTMFLTPEGAPFFGGTYFPKVARYNRPGFPDLCERVATLYRERQPEIKQQNASLLEALSRMQPQSSGAAHHSEFAAAAVNNAIEALKAAFEPEFGGFGGAPKFPHPTDLELLLRRYAATGDVQALHIASFTLKKMAEGGIYDQLGGGFARYSTDAKWHIPHFEKMLYDNGPLLSLAADCYAASGDALYKCVAEETAAWVMREMQSPEGGYYSAYDADSEGEEGLFYVWTTDQLKQLLAAEEYAVLAPHYGLDRAANFEGAYWHFYIARDLGAVAQSLGKPLLECAALLQSARAKLFAARATRVWPGRDDKILASWNALMIAGMARAARVFGRADWLASARKALTFIRATMWRQERLLATYKDGRAHLNAYLDDYAFLLAALLELMQADFRVDEFEFAEELAEVLLEQFEDREGGGFFFTSHDHERLIQRTKPGHDNATPSGNGVAAVALQRLGHISGETRFLNAAERTIALFYPAMAKNPGGYATLCMALEECLEPPAVLVLRGDAKEVTRWKAALVARFQPMTLVIAVPVGASTDAGRLPPLLDKPAPSSGVSAYLCRGVTCLAPVSDIGALEELLAQPPGG
ncbi:MAG: thioredoxin domain-containing protein [Betaproteobacteria bacterium]